MKNKSFPFYIMVITIFLGIASPMLFSDGMFMDGLIYATISRNLSQGIGSFWHLFYTQTGLIPFHEHPPLAMGLESILFWVFGDSIYVERWYSLITYLITGIIIVKIWKDIYPAKQLDLAWFPLLIWVLIPLNTWSVSNNMLENTMMIFTSLSTFLYLRAISTNQHYLKFIAGIMIFLAFLSKGPVGLFPLSLPFWVFMFDEKIKFKTFIIDTILVMLGLIIPLILIFVFYQDASESLISYLNKQVKGSINHVITVESRFFILGRLLSQLIPVAILSLLIYLTTRKTKIQQNKKWGYIFIGYALSGIVPIMVSMKQRGFYMIASLPIISIAIAYLIIPRVQILYNKILKSPKFRLFKQVNIVLLLGILIFMYSNSSKIGRDISEVSDVYSLSKIIPKNDILSSQKIFDQDYSLQAYLYRYGKISLESKHLHHYFLAKKASKSKIPKGYKKYNIDLNLFDLYYKPNYSSEK